MKKRFPPSETCFCSNGNQRVNDKAHHARHSPKRQSRLLTGFTLVEVLIVVIIIAILAALTVPRMIAQTKKAESAEATQMIGAMKRVAERNMALGGGGYQELASGENSWGWSESTAEAWEKIGLKKPTSSNWTYVYYYDPDYRAYAGIAFYKKEDGIEQYYYREGDSYEEYYCPGMTYIDESNPLLGCRLS